MATFRISFPKQPIIYRTFSRAEWSAHPKDHFDVVIRSWCHRHGFVQFVEVGKTIPARLPYRAAGDNVEVAEDFLGMVEKWRKVLSRLA